jgi:mannose-6-phosphate isomerase-like protein (cupin superfamily)
MVATDEPHEKDYGLIYDVVSWQRPIDTERASSVAGCQVFSALGDPQPGGPQSLARTRALAIYERTFAEGGGENGLHSHDDDAIWMVASGSASFFTSSDQPLGEVATGGGILVPAGTAYRFVCHGTTTMRRVAARTGDGA